MRQINLLSRGVWDNGNMRPGFRWRSAWVGKQVKAEKIGATAYDILEETEHTFPYHFHHGMEEWLIVVDGTPTLRMKWGERELRAGDVVCFPTGEDGGHQVRGPGTVLIVSASHAPESIEYPESGKIGVKPPGKIFKLDSEVDYWEGELAEEGAE
jgi:uncharacterized cupin superfamily protein